MAACYHAIMLALHAIMLECMDSCIHPCITCIDALDACKYASMHANMHGFMQICIAMLLCINLWKLWILSLAPTCWEIAKLNINFHNLMHISLALWVFLYNIFCVSLALWVFWWASRIIDLWRRIKSCSTYLQLL